MCDKPLDWNDPESIRRALVALRAAADDIDGVMRDMLRKRRRQSLGRVQHKDLCPEPSPRPPAPGVGG